MLRRTNKGNVIMRIVKLKLVGYKRIYLTGYKDIELDCVAKVQLLLGMNGSGKSSVLGECSPLPIAKSDLYPNGYKEVLINHLGKDYLLYNDANKASFIDLSTDTELNPGGTLQVQYQLCSEYFKYTKALHALLIGKDLFSQMNPAKRKEWLTTLSDTDYDYALKVFQSLKEAARDATGALKLARHKLAEATDNSNTSNASKLKEDITRLESQLELLQGLRDNSVGLIDNNLLDNLKSKLVESSSLLRRYYKAYPDTYYKDSSKLLNASKEALVIAKANYDTSKQQLLKLQEQHNEWLQIGVNNKEDLLLQLKELKLAIQELEEQKVLKLEYLDVVLAYTDLNSFSLAVTYCLLDLPSNENNLYSKAKLEYYHSRLLNLERTLDSYLTEVDNIKAKLDHLAKHSESTTCPQCSYSYILPKYSDETSSLEARLMDLDKLIPATKTELNTVKAEYSLQQNYQTLYETFTSNVALYPSLRPLWLHLSSTKLLSKEPRQVKLLLQHASRDLAIDLQLKPKLEELANLTNNLNNVDLTNNVSLQQLTKLIEDSESKVASNYEDYQTRLELVTRYENECNIQKSYYNATIELDKLYNEYKANIAKSIQSFSQQTLLQAIRQTQTTLGLLAKEYNDLERSSVIIQERTLQVQELEHKSNTLNTLVASLSPTTGLIAKGLVGFIQHLVNQLNNLIANVWTYPLVLETPDLETVDLDYKFPFTITDNKHVNRIADISLGSKGQREIIDLAFRVIACRYLRLQEVPIYADEFGTGLDETHRVRAAQLLKHIVQEPSYAQLFMISHYSEAHGSLVNADVTVLSKDNITVPTVYNVNTKLR